MKYGSIYKRETLASVFVDDESDYLVLKSNDPFPGYYCSSPNPADNSCKKDAFYLPVRNMPTCHEDIVCRISLEIYKNLKIQVCGANIMYAGKFVNAIRIKDINIKDIHHIVKIFKGNDIHFYKEIHVNAYLSKIYLKSFFTVKEIDEAVYQNIISPELFYFEIPDKLEWASFERLITFQKTNSSFKNFDAVLGYWIQKPEFVDFVRIYSNKLSLKQLLGIKSDFLKNLSQYKEEKILI